jgi:toxin ParE1/3/4
MNYKILIEPRALFEIQEAIDYYDLIKVGLGEYFYKTVDEYFEAISKNPFYEIRYKDYRALPIRNFPFLIIFYLDENIEAAYIISVFNTNLNPINYPK